MVVFATDEPIDVQAAEGSTILVRRMKQGFAEYFRYQLKAQMWEGLRQYVIGGWNTGKVPYGYRAERSIHPNPIKASMGATRARLVPDPERGPWVTRIYHWRVDEKLSRIAIARRLDRRRAVPGRQGLEPAAVAGILKNPKYTGRVVLGRTRNTGPSQRKGERKVRPVPRAYWTWAADDNRHPALVDMDLWEKAQMIGAERGNVRDTEHHTPASAARTVYPLRARIRCNQCQRRMHGITRPGRTPASKKNIYYVCPHDPGQPPPRPGPPRPPPHRTRDDEIIRRPPSPGSRDQTSPGHDRAAVLKGPAPRRGEPSKPRRHDRRAAALRQAAPAKIQTAQNGLLAQARRLAPTDTPAPAAQAMRDPHLRPVHPAPQPAPPPSTAELPSPHHRTRRPRCRRSVPARRAALRSRPAQPGPRRHPPGHLPAAFDIHCLYRHDQGQITIWLPSPSPPPASSRPCSTTPAPAPAPQPARPRPTCLQT